MNIQSNNSITVFEQWTINEQEDFRTQVRDALRRGEVEITFVKADGSTRVLRGTTDLNYVPASQHPKGIKPENPQVQPVWDLDKLEWRSFRWDRVSGFKIL